MTTLWLRGLTSDGHRLPLSVPLWMAAPVVDEGAIPIRA
jgi:hypothetical protein